MCATSAVFDYFGQQPNLYPSVMPSQVTNPQVTPAWTRDTFNEFKAIMDRLDALDLKLGQPDCDSPEKKSWMDDVERRLSAIEKGLS